MTDIPSGIVFRRPENLNDLSSLNFQMNFRRIPNVDFFVQEVEIPKIVLGPAHMRTPLSDTNEPGDKIYFEPLSISFIVDEYLNNYLEIYNWMIALGFPDNHTQFSEYVLPTKLKPRGNELSDASLIITTNSLNPFMEISFKDLWPTQLSGMKFRSTEDQYRPMTMDCLFYYTGSPVFKRIV